MNKFPTLKNLIGDPNKLLVKLELITECFCLVDWLIINLFIIAEFGIITTEHLSDSYVSQADNHNLMVILLCFIISINLIVNICKTIIFHIKLNKNIDSNIINKKQLLLYILAIIIVILFVVIIIPGNIGLIGLLCVSGDASNLQDRIDVLKRVQPLLIATFFILNLLPIFRNSLFKYKADLPNKVYLAGGILSLIFALTSLLTLGRR